MHEGKKSWHCPNLLPMSRLGSELCSTFFSLACASLKAFYTGYFLCLNVKGKTNICGIKKQSFILQPTIYIHSSWWKSFKDPDYGAAAILKIAVAILERRRALVVLTLIIKCSALSCISSTQIL